MDSNEYILNKKRGVSIQHLFTKYWERDSNPHGQCPEDFKQLIINKL
jgi:hypothetical protein